MKNKLLFSILTIIFIGSCTYRYYVNHNFRQFYTDMNEAIHMDTTQVDFFKIHLKNGDVSVMDQWQLNEAQDSLFGNGKLYDFNRSELHEGQLIFPVENIAIIETNQLKEIKSKDKERLSNLAILTGVNALVDILCLSNPKACFGSCPTFYLDGQQHFHSANAEGFSNSIAPSLEEKDIDALVFSTSATEFNLTMKNEAMETHVVNEVAVLAVPKKINEMVFQDEKGHFYNCGKLIPCKNAIVQNVSIKSKINKIDDLEYYSKTDAVNLAAKEKIFLEFDEVPQTDIGLVVNFRQTLVTTFLLYSALSYMGDEVGDYFAKLENNQLISDRIKNPYERLGDIDLFFWDDKKNEWILFDQIYETGPIATNLIISPIKDFQPTNKKLKIKIELAKGLWRLDYIGLTDIDKKSTPHIARPNKLEVVTGEAYTLDPVLSDDEKYINTMPGDEFKFTFNLPALEDDYNYELFVSSKGYYLEWIRSDWLKRKDKSKLKNMLLGNDATWRELAEEFKSMEHEMEEVFWNSKYAIQ